MEPVCDSKLAKDLSEGEMATVDIDMKDNKLQAVLSNNIVAERILSNLSFDEMKTASEVSRLFHQMVRGSMRFKEKAVLVVREDTMELAHLLLTTQQTWRGVRIGVMMSMKVLYFLSHILERVEFISLVWVGRTRAKDFEVAEAKFISSVLSCSPKLTQLQIDICLLKEILFRDVLACENVLENVKNLRRLEFLEWNDKFCAIKKLGGITLHQFLNNENMHFTRLLDNFEQFGRLPMRLELFRMDRVKFRFLHTQLTGFMLFSPVISKNQWKTLEEVRINLNAWKLDDLHAVRLPVLKKLVVTINPEDQEMLGVFLTNHPLMEELEIGVTNQFSRNLLHVLEKSCLNLRKFHLKTTTFSGYGEGEKVDWSFLGKMELLKDFRISCPFNTATNFEVFGTGPRFLSALPKNQLECLSFKGMSMYGFWPLIDEVVPELAYKTNLLSGFRNIKRLSLVRCHNVVDDNLLQFILREFLSLEELELSHCKWLSDAGITGNGQEGGVSLRNLQRLTSLSIRACPAVTTDGLLSSLALPNLRAFEYLTPLPVPNSFVVQLLEQNPSLAKIGIQMKSQEEQLEVKVKDACGRLVKVVNLERRWINNDSDSEAEVMDFGMEDDSDDSSLSDGSDNDNTGDLDDDEWDDQHDETEDEMEDELEKHQHDDSDEEGDDNNDETEDEND